MGSPPTADSFPAIPPQRCQAPTVLVHNYLMVGLPKVHDDLAARTIRDGVADAIRSTRAKALVLDLAAVDGLDRRMTELVDNAADARAASLSCIAHDPRSPFQQSRDHIGARICIDTVRSLDEVADSVDIELTA